MSSTNCFHDKITNLNAFQISSHVHERLNFGYQIGINYIVHFIIILSHP